MPEQMVTLQPGESEVLAFETIPSEAKTYQVSVDGLNGSFVAVEKGVEVRIKNPPYRAEEWQLSIRDWNKTRIASKFYIPIGDSATFEIPPGTIFPLRVDMLIYHNSTIDYRMQSIATTFPYPAQWYVAAFIPDYGSYYYNVSTEQFEKYA